MNKIKLLVRFKKSQCYQMTAVMRSLLIKTILVILCLVILYLQCYLQRLWRYSKCIMFEKYIKFKVKYFQPNQKNRPNYDIKQTDIGFALISATVISKFAWQK